MKLKTTFLVAALMAFAFTAQAVTIDLVPVGDPGNANDTESGYGGVDYTYLIGKYEITAGQYTEFLNKVAGVDTYGLYNLNMSNTSSGSGITRSGGGTIDNPYTYSVEADFLNRPVNWVSWGDATRFTNWLQNNQPTGAQGLSTTEDGAYYLNGATNSIDLMAVADHKAGANYWIPSENEWYKAAYYKSGSTNAGYWLYPTQSNSPPGQDMSEATNAGNNANYYTAPYVYPIDSGHYTTVVGQFHLSNSPYGTFDQGGNVWEWNETAVTSSYRGLRGGTFMYDSNYMIASNCYVYDPMYEWSDFGFRVAYVPEPGSIMLLVCGAIAGLIWWKRRK